MNELLLNRGGKIYFSEKADGDMLFKSELPEVNAEVKKNREAFFKKFSIPQHRLVNLGGVHSNKIYIVKESDLGKGALDEATRIRGVDGLITNISDSFLMVTGADCFPILFFEKNRGVIGALHVGWRGLIRDIIRNAFETLTEKFGGDSQNTYWWIGPGIRKCHFEIGADVKNLFSERYSNFVFERKGKFYADLPQIINFEILTLGAKKENLLEQGDCTYCLPDKWFSYRRDKPSYIAASAFVIGLRKNKSIARV
jgi:hypothetical protein